ncbi:glycosyl hydrolase 115 family protein [Paenibacillus mucilaginosus]|uniref:glycosyl hydrolase 115 family protein n=1 Tax=Paenibacillus mucilaginosus TaxID=61624 RepID=UPI001F23D642|nr:glycosyl hydrolase 115 family protein [Paenibacillus mucilaginosus]MCG7216276.1 glycosyl hydrolase 115 family protein [Paenibacillus mucilaginosus]
MSQQSNEALRLKGRVRIGVPGTYPSSVAHAIRMLGRDLEAVLGAAPELVAEEESAELRIRLAAEEDRCPERPEAFGFRSHMAGGRPRMDIVGRDELGLVYGILEFSRLHLGIQPFWFWADQSIAERPEIVILPQDYDAPAPKVRYRGWFVNDEVCLIGWKEPYPPSREVWEPVFEALLRCGGNMVIPGTDLPRDGIHYKLAAEMGLWVTHHHAEPLGAEMFLRAYPGRTASYQEAPELFEALWQEAIEEQKDMKVLWVLSFRGQGDKPFWIDDPSFDTSEKRGAMISRVIRKQYDMIASAVRNPVYCAALYGEIAELYKGGYVDLPEDVIKVWADNGYGRMVSRRHGNQNFRVPALPAAEDGGKHGLYYHVTFHDLQASNHLTMFPGPASFLKREIESAFEAGADEYLLLNCGNIRPHVYTLDVLRELWNAGTIDVNGHLGQFVRDYYSSHHDELAALYQSYAEAALPYGPHEDDLAGDEYYHHPARKIIGHWLQGKGDEPHPRLAWAVGDVPFEEQVKGFEARLEQGMGRWKAWLERCSEVLAQLGPDERRRAADQLMFHGALHLSGCEGFYWLCRSYREYRRERCPQAFVFASESMWAYQKGLDVLRDAEHGKWDRFYRADWLTNIESTVQNVDTLRRFLRMHGDSPDFFLWYKEYLMPVTEKYIYLENTHRNPLSDDELAGRLKEYFQQEGML